MFRLSFFGIKVHIEHIYAPSSVIQMAFFNYKKGGYEITDGWKIYKHFHIFNFQLKLTSNMSIACNYWYGWKKARWTTNQSAVNFNPSPRSTKLSEISIAGEEDGHRQRWWCWGSCENFVIKLFWLISWKNIHGVVNNKSINTRNLRLNPDEFR